MSEVASQSEEVQEQPLEEKISGAMEAFGLTPQEDKQEEANEEEAQEKLEDESEEPPAIEEPKVFRKVKYNKKEVDVTEDQVDELLQKGLAMDKVREKQSETEKALTRAAKLAGFDKVDDYLSNLDKIENEAVQKQKDHFETLRKELREDAESSGLDPDKVEEYIDNHPLLKQANEVLSRQEAEKSASQQKQTEEARVAGWKVLFDKYPKLADEVSEDGSQAPWITPEMQERINRGYDPVDAYELVHGASIREEDRKRTEQSVIKQQRLNKRAKVEGNVEGEKDEGVPDTVKNAFSMFGLDPKTAKKFMKK